MNLDSQAESKRIAKETTKAFLRNPNGDGAGAYNALSREFNELVRDNPTMSL